MCAAGFGAVFEMMRASKKPAVGHNLSLDLAFSLAAFAQPLPLDWKDYKLLVARWCVAVMMLHGRIYISASMLPSCPFLRFAFPCTSHHDWMPGSGFCCQDISVPSPTTHCLSFRSHADSAVAGLRTYMTRNCWLAICLPCLMAIHRWVKSMTPLWAAAEDSRFVMSLLVT